MNGNFYQYAALQRQIQEQLEEIRKVLHRIMDKGAIERLANVRLVKPELATQVELYLFQLYKAGKLSHVSEQMVIELLRTLSSKRKTKIKIKRK